VALTRRGGGTAASGLGKKGGGGGGCASDPEFFREEGRGIASPNGHWGGENKYGKKNESPDYQQPAPKAKSPCCGVEKHTIGLVLGTAKKRGLIEHGKNCPPPPKKKSRTHSFRKRERNLCPWSKKNKKKKEKRTRPPISWARKKKSRELRGGTPAPQQKKLTLSQRRERKEHFYPRSGKTNLLQF